jgi:hypothetical protein
MPQDIMIYVDSIQNADVREYAYRWVAHIYDGGTKPVVTDDMLESAADVLDRIITIIS